MTRATALEPGTELDGTYRIVEPLGEGGMGAVYVAELVRLPKRVALKVLHVAADEGAKARFRREAEIAAKVRHPRIVEVLDYNFLEDGSPYLVMELLDGHDLRHRIAQGPMPAQEVLAVLSDTASALERLHELGIVHRDLKPENIFLAQEGDEVRAKVLDFGISKVMDAGTALTADRSVLGTPAYMAPEQVTGENTALDPRTDQFALAAVAYEMVTGQPAFQGDNVMQLFHRILSDPPPTVTGAQAYTPVDEVLAKAMSKTREARYPSVRAFVAALGEALGHGVPRRSDADALAHTVASGELDAMAHTMASGEVAPGETPPPPSRGRDKRLLWGGAGGLVGIAALVAVLLTGRGEEGAARGDAHAVSAAEAEKGEARATTADPDRSGANPAAGAGTHAGSVPRDAGQAASAVAADDAHPDDPDPQAATGADAPGADVPATDGPEKPSRAPRPKAPSSGSGAPSDPEALSRLKEAEASLATGDSSAAIRLARMSLQKQRSMAAQAVLAKAQCARRDLGLAKAMARSLRGAARRDAERYCREHGIEL